MKKLYPLILFSMLTLLVTQLDAQVRYLDEITQSVDVAVNEVYGENWSVLPVALGGTPEIIDLLMDVYTPGGDTETERPVILVPHTGSFLPQYFNGQITGGKSDSTVVNICRRLAKRGYVAVAITNRMGWNPLATSQDERTGTLLQAAYRAIQDTRTCIRYFRKTVDIDGNPYGIDPDKIGVMGVGTGGYLAFGAATLDRYEEVTLDKFLDENNLPLADTVLLGNFWATNTAPLCVANHPGYSSDFKICVNLGGALADISWLEGKETEPAFVGFHSSGDVFAPFCSGAVIVPTTGEFVVNVEGTRCIIEQANVLGNNDIFNTLEPINDPLDPIIEAYKNLDIMTVQGQTLPAAVDNMYPFLLFPPQGGPWDWWDKATLDFIIPIVNTMFGTNFSSDTLHMNGLLTNPDMSAEKGNTYLDTVFMFTLPRACAAFNLACFPSFVKELEAEQIGLTLAPNPAHSSVLIKTADEHPIQSVYLYDIQGKLVKARTNLFTNEYEMERNDLPDGIYFAKIKVNAGVINKKIIFN